MRCHGRDLVILLAASTPLGCTVGADYNPAMLDVPGRFEHASSDESLADAATWWRRLDDPTLNQLIERALVANHDLRVARTRVREARAQLGLSEAALLPTIDATASATRSRYSENQSTQRTQPSTGGGSGAAPTGGGAGGAPSSASSSNRAFRQDLFVAGFDAAWEIDLFGRVAREVEAANRDLEAEEYAVDGVRVAMIGELVTAYVDVRGSQRRQGLLRESVALQEESIELAQIRFDAGFADEFDLIRSQQLVAQLKARLPPLDEASLRAIHRIATLTGSSVAEIRAIIGESASLPTAAASTLVGIPADLLWRRPDLRRAERELAAASARVAAAEGERYPRVVLNGSFQFVSDDIDQWLEWPSHAWSIGPSISLPIFDGDRIDRRVEARSAQEERGMIALEQQLFVAMEEVENGIVGLTRERQRVAHLRESVRSAERANTIAEDRYDAGLTPFLDVLDSRRQWIDDRDALAISEQRAVHQEVALYKALGGGWSPR